MPALCCNQHLANSPFLHAASVTHLLGDTSQAFTDHHDPSQGVYSTNHYKQVAMNQDFDC